VAAALAAVIVATGTALADGGKPQVKFTAADQTAARAAVIRRSDLARRVAGRAERRSRIFRWGRRARTIT